MTVQVLGRRFPAAATYVGLLGVALLLLSLTVVAAFWQADRQRAVADDVRFSFEVRAEARQLLIELQNAETGQRGFLLTNDIAYLEPYRTARLGTEAQIDLLEVSAAAEPRLREPVARARALAQRKFDELETTIGLARNGRRSEALLIVGSDVGKQVMDDLRAELTQIVESEGVILNDAIERAERDSLTLRLIVLLAALLLLAIGVLLVIAVRGAVRELRESRDAAQASNARLVAEMDARQQAEHKIVQMQKMEAIGQLTGGVAHDFNNMLAVITSALTLMQRRIERGDYEVKTYVDGALDAARRAATLVSRLLAFARRQPLTPEVIQPNQMVSGMSELLRRTLGEQVQLETVLAGGLWNTYADASQLENAIVNVCVNARDAMTSGGKLTIETANAHLDADYAAANQDVKAGQYVMIAITDTGAGMAPDVIARAFEPFFTTKDVGKGTGLGLSHVHGFLKQSGGHAAIYSEVGHGTTVKLYLPRSQRTDVAQQAAQPSAAETPTGSADTRILVVEDDARVRAMSTAALRELGYTVIEADSGAAALEALRTTPNVTLLFTDIVMPDMSGRVLVDQAKGLYPAVKVLYTTGYTQNAIVHNGVVDADASLLMKPYTLEQLARKIRAVLDA